MRRIALLGVVTLASCSESPVHPPGGPVGTLRVTATTTGDGAKPTLLQLMVDDDAAVIIDANGSHVFEDVSVGELAARLVVPGHCTADHFAPRTVEIREGETAELSWAVRCPAPAAPGLYFRRLADFDPWEVMRTDLDGAHPAVVLQDAHTPLMNPSRTRLAWISGPNPLELWVGDPDGQNAVNTGLTAYSYDWSPDGRFLVVESRLTAQTKEVAIRWPDGALVRTLRTGNVGKVAWAPDGRHIAYRDAGYLNVMDLETGARVNTLDLSGGVPAWSPDGTRLALVQLDPGVLYTIRADGSDLREVRRGNIESSIDWHPDGTIAFSESIPLTAIPYSIYTVPANGGTPTLAFPRFDAGTYNQPRWAP